MAGNEGAARCPSASVLVKCISSLSCYLLSVVLMYCVKLAQLELHLLDSLYVWFLVSVGHRRNLCEIWKVEVKQQPILCSEGWDS